MGLAMFLPSSAGAVPCGASVMTTLTWHVIIEGQHLALRPGNAAEHLQDQIGEQVAIPVEGGDDKCISVDFH